MNQAFAKACRVAADRIEGKKYNYKWKDQNRCQMGLVTGALLGKTVKEVEEELGKTLKRLKWENPRASTDPNGRPTWEEFAAMTFKLFKKGELAKTDIFFKLFFYGLTPAQITKIEYLQDARICKKARITFHKMPDTSDHSFLNVAAIYEFYNDDGPFTVKESVIRYLRALADDIDRKVASISA